MVSCHVGNTRQRDGDGGTTCIIYNCIYDKCFTSIARIPRICKITEPMKWGGISQYQLVRLAELAKIKFMKSKVLPSLSLSLAWEKKTSLLYNDFNDKYLLVRSTFHFQSLSNVSYLVAKCHTEKGFTLLINSFPCAFPWFLFTCIFFGIKGEKFQFTFCILILSISLLIKFAMPTWLYIFVK